MITGKKEELDDIAKNYVCKEHNHLVTVAWHENAYSLRCGFETGHYPEEVTRQANLTELCKQGQELPEPIQSNVKKAIEKRAARLPQAPQAVTFTGTPAADLGTGELLTFAMLSALVGYAQHYGLDPARGHVCLMYGKPYITIDGYLYHARKSDVSYSLASRPLHPDEIKLYQITEGSYAWLATVQFISKGDYCTGLGIVTQDEMTEMSRKKPGQLASPVVAKHPWQLAQKRAEWQALRRAFPIGESPQGEEE